MENVWENSTIYFYFLETENQPVFDPDLHTELINKDEIEDLGSWKF